MTDKDSSSKSHIVSNYFDETMNYKEPSFYEVIGSISSSEEAKTLLAPLKNSCHFVRSRALSVFSELGKIGQPLLAEALAAAALGKNKDKLYFLQGLASYPSAMSTEQLSEVLPMVDLVDEMLLFYWILIVSAYDKKIILDAISQIHDTKMRDQHQRGLIECDHLSTNYNLVFNRNISAENLAQTYALVFVTQVSKTKPTSISCSDQSFLATSLIATINRFQRLL